MLRSTAVVIAALAGLALTACGSSSKSGSGSTATSVSSPASPTKAPATATTATATTPTPATTVPATTVPGVVSGSSGGVSASMHVGTHNPRVNRPWPLSFTVTGGGAPAKASVSYEYLFGGQVVAKRSHYDFTGHFADVFRWPSSAVGYPLTFRAVIVSGKATVDLDYAVQVVR